MQRADETQWNARVDHRVSQSDRLTIRYSGGRADLFEPYTEGTGVTAGFGDFVNDGTWNAMAEYEHAFHGGTNSLRFGANGFSRDILTENHETNVGAAWGVDWLNVPPDAFGYPVLDVAGYSRIGDAFGLPILRNATTLQAADAVSISRGHHLFKAGADLRYIRLNSQVDLFSRGQLSFPGTFTGTGIGDLLLGLPTFTLQAQSDNPIRMRTHAVSAYAQDDWRVARDITLDLGVRYEFVSPPIDANDGMSVFDVGTGDLVRVGSNGVSRSGIKADRNNVAPRVGFSWQPRPNTAVRAGYGLFYDAGMLTVNTSLYFNPPWFNLRVFFPSSQGLLTLDDPFPLDRGFVPPATVSSLSPDLVTARMQHWNFAVERDIASLGVVTLAYAGSRGSHLIRPRDLNQPVPGPGDLQARRPYPAYSNVFFVESEGSSRFDALEALFNRRLSRGVSLSAVYTLSKSTDEASAFLGTPADKNFPQDSRNPDAERGPSSFDVRHRLAVAYIIDLPGGNRWTGDMQIQGVTIVHTGQPFTPVLRFDNSNTGNSGGSTAGSDRPDLIGDPALAHPSADRWFNTDAFAIAPQYSFGNSGRNIVRGPGFASFDVSVTKRFAVHGRTTLMIGLQTFNLFNRANLDLPEYFADEPATFGRIFSAKAPREVQLVMRVGF